MSGIVNYIQYTSQLGQDRTVLEYFGNIRGGFFVELGAHDGVELSNTLVMERDFAWNGLCIEPNPETFERLRTNRKCLCCNGLISDSNGKDVEFCISRENAMYSGSKGSMSRPENATVVNLKTYTLTHVLDLVNAPRVIEFLSLDTEGTELDILRGVDWERYRFLYMCIEHNYEEPRRTQIRQFLEGKGYTYKGENKWDDDYVWLQPGKKVV